MKAEIWISRDLQGLNCDSLYFWNEKPSWDHTRCTWCGESDTEICSISANSCADMKDIFAALGLIPEDDKGLSVMYHGILTSLSVTSKITKEQTLSAKAGDLRERLAKRGGTIPRKELLDFLGDLSEVVDEEDLT